MSLKNSYIEHKDWAKYSSSDNVIFIDFDTWFGLFNPENDSWFFEKRTKYGDLIYDYTSSIEYYLLSYTLKNRVTKRICFKTYKDYKQFHKFIEHYEKVKIYNEQKENLDKFINAIRKEEQEKLEW